MLDEEEKKTLIRCFPTGSFVRRNVGSRWRANNVYLHRYNDPDYGASFGITTDRDQRLVVILDREAKPFCSMLDKVGRGGHSIASVETVMLGKLTLLGKNVTPFDNERAHLLAVPVWEKGIWFKLRDGVPEAISSAIKNCIAEEALSTSL